MNGHSISLTGGKHAVNRRTVFQSGAWTAAYQAPFRAAVNSIGGRLDEPEACENFFV
jgi:hypothetical protein